MIQNCCSRLLMKRYRIVVRVCWNNTEMLFTSVDEMIPNCCSRLLIKWYRAAVHVDEMIQNCCSRLLMKWYRIAVHVCWWNDTELLFTSVDETILNCCLRQLMKWYWIAVCVCWWNDTELLFDLGLNIIYFIYNNTLTTEQLGRATSKVTYTVITFTKLLTLFYLLT